MMDNKKVWRSPKVIVYSEREISAYIKTYAESRCHFRFWR